MTLFETLFGPTNPTKTWLRASDLRLDFHLEVGALNGVRLTKPLIDLSFLGPVEDRAALRSGEFRYFSLGLSIGSYKAAQTIDYFELVQNDSETPQYRPFPGQCHYGEKNLRLSGFTEELFRHEVGPPFWRDQDDEEVILFYEFPSLEWQVEFSLKGALNRIVVNAEPLMADERQREAYGVTQQWPPKT